MTCAHHVPLIYQHTAVAITALVVLGICLVVVLVVMFQSLRDIFGKSDAP